MTRNTTTTMNTTNYQHLIKVLRHCGNPNVSCKGCMDAEDCHGSDGAWEIGAEANMREAAEAIEKLLYELRLCRDELCLQCGDYKLAHKGACDGCRWKDGGDSHDNN